MNARLRPISRTFTGGFTLVELLIVMGVIGVLSVLTLVSVKAITADARLSSATNTVTAALGNARALAMKKNQIVLVAFRPIRVGANKQAIEIVTAAWSGESTPARVNSRLRPVDRFVPTHEVELRRLPTGIKVAGPGYAMDADFIWITQSHLPRTELLTESRGQILAVMYAPDGTTITRNSQSDADRLYVDFDDNRTQLIGGDEVIYPQDLSQARFDDVFLFQVFGFEEPYVEVVPFLAVFDDEEAREMFGDDDWTDGGVRTTELTKYITQNADRIHFNRYTGVVMK